MKKLMKIGRVLLMVTAIAAVFTSCKKDPTASFTYSPENPVQYDLVTFTNTSTEANVYLWEIGSGSSVEASPTVRLNDAGDYIVKLTATGEGGSQTIEKTITVAALDNHYMMDDKKIAITTDLAWASGHGGNYLKFSSAVDGQDYPDELRLSPVLFLDGLVGTYTWDTESDPLPVGTYSFIYYKNFSGGFGGYDWYGQGKTGSGDLVIEEMETDVYKVTGEMIITVGTWDYSVEPYVYTETAAYNLTLSYIGAITPLAK